MSRTDETLDLIESLRDTPPSQRRRRVARLARPTLEALTLVLLDRRRKGAAADRGERPGERS